MAKQKVDWAAYDLALKQRGSITFWLSGFLMKLLQDGKLNQPVKEEGNPIIQI